MERTPALSSLQEKVLTWEPMVPILLSIHGTALLLIEGGVLWQWLIIIATILLGICLLNVDDVNPKFLALRVAIIFIFAWALLLSTGGVDSYFLFWFVVLLIVYPFLLTKQLAIALWCAIPLSYMLIFFIDHDPMPIPVVLARLILLSSIGALGSGLRFTISRYLGEREQVEQALARSEEYFRALIERIHDIIAVLNVDGTIRYISPSVKHALGYDNEDVHNRHFTEFLHPEDNTLIMAHGPDIKTLVSLNRSLETRFRHKDGTWCVFEVVGTDLLDDPIVGGIVVNARNITERKHLEEQIRQVQKIEAVGQLTTGIAHDFNNLLIPIQGYAELMKLRLSPGDPNRDMVDKILFSSERATNLIRQLLAFSRKQVTEVAILDLNTIVTEMDKLLTRTLGDNIQLQTKLATGLWPVLADPTQVEQIIINLAVNARDAMPDGGELQIETANIVIDKPRSTRYHEMPNDDYVCLLAQDSGIGMNDEVLSHIFEPFFTTKQPGKGTGMGLATVYGIVKQHGGYIEVTSEPDQGTTFQIYLPRTNAVHKGHRHEMKAEVQVHRGYETILLVEDDIDVQEFVSQVLTEQGYCLLRAHNGEEALAILSQHNAPIHLLLTDVIMPGMNGKALAEEIAQLGATVKILYISGYDDELIADHGVVHTGVTLLQKPFGPTALVSKVREVLDSA